MENETIKISGKPEGEQAKDEENKIMKPRWFDKAKRQAEGLESGVIWKADVIEESYNREIENVTLVDEKGMPQAFDSFSTGDSQIMFTGVPKGWKLIRSPKILQADLEKK